ncbi:MAG: DUF58 domain-containing protein [Myxococcales bacterium]|nr:DUF58 domain-containing protein [Myxococcales bacterium]
MNTVRPRRHKPTSNTPKEAVLLAWFFLAPFGVHRMILGSYAVGLLYALLTVLTCGVGGFIGYADGFVLLLGTPRDQHGLPVVWSWRKGKLTVDPLEEGTFEPTEAVARILLHVGLIFLLPYVVVSGTISLFETSEVKATAGTFAALSAIVLVPLMLVQLAATVKKARAQIALLRKANALTRRTRLDAIARSASILTPRGGLILLTGLAFLVLSLAYQWASLGVIAIFALASFYLVVAAQSLLSAFVVKRFSSDLLERGAVVHRKFEPGVARAGDLVRDVLDVKGVPVPPGFFLTMSGTLPPRLATEVRHVVPPKSRNDRLSLSVLLKRTPRGTYDAPPLRIAFSDLLGLTSAPVASLSTARVRVLPAVRPAEVIAPPPTNTEEPDILSRPHRFPTEDLFRFREYVAGDDTRRIHWEMSLRAGRMIVKTPDSRESSAKRVVVALDTWVPPDWLDHTAVIDDALDSIVEAWLAIGQRLVQQGEKVTLLLVARAGDGTLKPEIVSASTGNHAHGLDAGARAEWQSTFRIEDVLDFGIREERQDQRGAAEDVAFDNAIVVTMRLAPPSMPRVARETTWVYYDPDDALGPMPRTPFQTWVDFDDTGRTPTFGAVVKRLLFMPHPIGAEENGLVARMKHLERRLEDRAHRLALRRRAVMTGRQALGALLALPDAVYRLEIVDGQHRLVGLKGSMRAARTVDKNQGQRMSAPVGAWRSP